MTICSESTGASQTDGWCQSYFLNSFSTVPSAAFPHPLCVLTRPIPILRDSDLFGHGNRDYILWHCSPVFLHTCTVILFQPHCRGEAPTYTCIVWPNENGWCRDHNADSPFSDVFCSNNMLYKDCLQNSSEICSILLCTICWSLKHKVLSSN